MMKYAYVAFIDILGFSDMVRADCEDGRQEFSNLKKLKSAIEDASACYNKDGVNVIQFSDSIIIYGFYDNISFISFMDVCSELQSRLFRASILCRGGVSVGRHYHSKSILFSEGLIDAYKIENRIAKYPRIVISKNLIELVNYRFGRVDLRQVLSDSDGVFFVDYLDGLTADVVSSVLRERLLAVAGADVGVLEKVKWMLSYAEYKGLLESDCMPRSGFSHCA